MYCEERGRETNREEEPSMSRENIRTHVTLELKLEK